MQKQLRSLKTYFLRQRRDTRYVFVALISLIFFVLSTLQALDTGLFDSVERPIFDSINSLPNIFDGVMYAVTQFGGAGSVLLWMLAAYLLINKRAAFMVGGAGMLGWYSAKIFKALIGRGRPEALLETLNLYADKQIGGFGFPSGHATFAATCATVLYYQVDRSYRKYLLMIAFAVGISRIYLGAHFPLDIVGGWALGAFIGSLVCLIFGVSVRFLTVVQIKSAMRKKGYPMKHVQFADVDARGSRPLFMEDDEGKEYFGKVFGVQEHAADWLFKLYRFFRFKNLQAEEPYISSRRNIEMESFATLWAKQNGIRVPTIVDLIRIQSSWLLILEKLDTIVFSEHKKIKQTTLVDAWRQVEKMHKANMAHRDLRAANLMIDKKGNAWIIDFGFAEIAPRKQRQYMDVAELLMSMSLVVGVKRTLDAALSTVEHKKLERVLPYLQREVFSGATAKSLRSNKSLLDELKENLRNRLSIDEEEVDEVNIIRLNSKKLLNILLFGALIYVITPQLNLFSGTLKSLASMELIWIIPILIATLATYAASGIGLMILSSVPLKLLPTTLVQLAASFMSKILPAGIGSASLNARYLYKAGHEKSDAAAILATHNIIGFMMFIIPVSIFLLFNGEALLEVFKVELKPVYFILGSIILLVLGLLIYFIKTVRHKIIRAVVSFVTSLREFTNSRSEVALANLSALGVSLGYILCLYFSFQAFNIPLSFSAAIFVYISAVVAKTAVPTPGGLGPLEIAMVSALITLGISNTDSLSVVVLYRLATFWLPVPFSLLAYKYLSQKKIV